MEKTAIGTNDLGMHIVIRPISKDLLSKDEIVGMETGKINSLLTARRPITFVDAISALPPLLPSSADPITGRRLYSVNEIMSGSCGMKSMRQKSRRRNASRTVSIRCASQTASTAFQVSALDKGAEPLRGVRVTSDSRCSNVSNQVECSRLNRRAVNGIIVLVYRKGKS